jgi:WXXGXW repeat (2 copies)
MGLIRTLMVSFVVCCLSAFPSARAQIALGISIDVAPPPLPVYDQPPMPATGYIWTPGYWAWDDNTGYYWVPGTWVMPPQPELLWTPGYWGWNDGVYAFHEGYWGPEVGFYGGVSYGFGYGGVGYEGGYWRGGAFFYNRSVNNISNVQVTNVYNKTVVVNNTTNVSYNGGTGGTAARATPQQIAAANQPHVPPTQQQTQHMQTAAKDPSLSLNNNHGHPSVAATSNAAQLSGAGVIAAHPGTPVAAIAPQGHSIRGTGGAATGNAATTPGSHSLPGVQQHGSTPAGTTVGSTNTSPDVKMHRGAATGTTGTTGSGTGAGAGTGAATGTGAGSTPPTKKLPATAVHTPTQPSPQIAKPPPTPPAPQAAKPPPPPKPHVASPSPPRPAPPPPPKPPAKPAPPKKCPPGQQHC